MTIEQMILLLAAFIASVLVGYILMMIFEWRREDESAANDHWEVGCRIRSSRDPHSFLPGVWMPSVTFSDGSREWERIA